MRYLYVLAVDGPGPYQRMTALSALSARAWDPAAHVTLLTDARSARALASDGDAIGADAVIVTETPDADARTRSRQLKTAMRDAVTGDFLFLDSDTVVCGDLSPLATATADLAAVSDQHRTAPCLPKIEEEVYAACGWRRPTTINLNSGVLYWRDTPAAHDLGALWRKKWEDCRAVTGRHNDQQALNSALEDGSATVAELPAFYNAQVGLRPETAFDARVWHIFSSDLGRVPNMRTVFDPYWDGRAALDPAALKPLFCSAHPFDAGGPLDAAVVACLARRRNTNLPFNDWRRLWLAGDRPGALKALARAGRAAVARRRPVLLGRRPGSPVERLR